MSTYVDSSALLKRYVDEADSDDAEALLQAWSEVSHSMRRQVASSWAEAQPPALPRLENTSQTPYSSRRSAISKREKPSGIRMRT